jgi:hypothetical protein
MQVEPLTLYLGAGTLLTSVLGRDTVLISEPYNPAQIFNFRSGEFDIIEPKITVEMTMIADFRAEN